MHKIVIEGRREFDSIEAADQFCSELDSADQDWYGCVSDPFTNTAVVSFGHRVEMTMEEDRADAYSQLARAMQKDALQEAEEFNKKCEQRGREAAAKSIAKEAGYKGQQAQMFCAGFMGLQAKYVKPRDAGMEEEFRAGRIAWGSSEAQRAYRAACVAARSA